MVRLISLQIILALFSLLSFLASSSSIVSSQTIIPLPDRKIKPNQTRTTTSDCPFVVEIATSCNSVRHTRDEISVRFGDAYGNLVEKDRLGRFHSDRPFQACSSDAFNTPGPCTADICTLRVRRKGSDGWSVNSVRVSSPYIKARTFVFSKNSVPANTWFGFNQCKKAVASDLVYRSREDE